MERCRLLSKPGRLGPGLSGGGAAIPRVEWSDLVGCITWRARLRHPLWAGNLWLRGLLRKPMFGIVFMPKDAPQRPRRTSEWLFYGALLTVFGVCAALVWFLIRLLMIFLWPKL